MTTSKRAVLLLSGGLDSSTVLAMLAEEKREIYAVSFDYGQRHTFELESSRKLAAHYKAYVKEHIVVPCGAGAFGGSALTDAAIDVPKNREETTGGAIPSTYVPARNTIFLSYALGFAETRKAYDIYIGANHLDYSGYPDCRPDYLRAFEKMANLALADTVEGRGEVRICAPLLEMNKTQIVQLGVKLGAPYGLTHSCYAPSDQGAPCGECDACMLRRRGFEGAGAIDPTAQRPAA